LLALILTIVVETLINLLVIKRKKKEIIFYSFLINLFTQPLANFSVGFLLINFYLIEFIVVGVEAILIQQLYEFSFRKSLLISLVTNVPTALLSFVI
jgi:hypothetical protein